MKRSRHSFAMSTTARSSCGNRQPTLSKTGHPLQTQPQAIHKTPQPRPLAAAAQTGCLRFAIGSRSTSAPSMLRSVAAGHNRSPLNNPIDVSSYTCSSSRADNAASGSDTHQLMRQLSSALPPGEYLHTSVQRSCDDSLPSCTNSYRFASTFGSCDTIHGSAQSLTSKMTQRSMNRRRSGSSNGTGGNAHGRAATSASSCNSTNNSNKPFEFGYSRGYKWYDSAGARWASTNASRDRWLCRLHSANRVLSRHPTRFGFRSCYVMFIL
mmetsp:Transcript_1127/g.2236  ORF Transcript_1127/g.2236 Transcript_1127/m.2236 type:complete len:267 (+) Transcript_1127:385-1185(+)